MANGLKGLFEKHAEQAKDGSFESLMCQFALEVLEWKNKRRKFFLFYIGVVFIPIVLIVLEKIL